MLEVYGSVAQTLPHQTDALARVESNAPTQALCCAAVVPCGLDHKGMPFGLQIVGPRGSDLMVLEVALALEQAMVGTDMARPLPKIG